MVKIKELQHGKAKIVYSTSEEDINIIYFTDETIAFNGIKKACIPSKGILNNKITAILFQRLADSKIPTHFIKRLNDREQLCHNVNIIPLQIIVRNIIAGSMAKRLNITEGTFSPNVIYEICYKDSKLGDPLINDHHAVALGVCTYLELDIIYNYAKLINELLKEIFLNVGVKLVDMKLEFGKNANGEIILADEISPDTCRLWDLKTNKKLDKDRFRHDLGSVIEAYENILVRLENYENK